MTVLVESTDYTTGFAPYGSVTNSVVVTNMEGDIETFKTTSVFSASFFNCSVKN